MKKDFLTFILCFVFVFEISAQTKKFDWGKSEYTGRPWIENTSRPNTITDGLMIDISLYGLLMVVIMM